ncbi:MAG: methylated-DNA--[protein]-cysteine S-methyltransferase [Cyclobacteriaceae bacterium]|nr:methylated-DNA--[protein]-cysteine S-methyltransferase [Cyclobacteriaceae bacterium HetDA_MAG_MS6]
MRKPKIHTKIDSPVGKLLLLSDSDFLTGVYFYKERNGFGFRNEGYGLEDNNSDLFRETTQQLQQYFGGHLQNFNIPVKFKGTDFQKSVWNALFTIPYGETVSYLDVAKQIGDPTAARAVGWANGKNPIPIIYPCHRVIGSNGKLTGYGGGLDRKEWLLRHEGSWPLKTVQTSLF